MELIDRKTLEHAFDIEPYDVVSYNGDGFSFEKVCELIDKAPTVKRDGHWISQLDDDWECSECLSWYGRRYSYCPHCGSRMENAVW